MRCDETQERVSLLIDSDLAETEQGPMFRHLEGCPDCRAFMDSVIRLRKQAAAERESLLSEAGEILPSAETILRRARRAESSRPSVWQRIFGSGFRIPAPVAVGIGIALLVIGIVLGARSPGGGGRAVSGSDRVEPASRPAVVVVCGLPEVEVIGSGPRR